MCVHVMENKQNIPGQNYNFYRLFTFISALDCFISFLLWSTGYFVVTGSSGQTNLISGSTDFFSKFEGSVGREKKENKKKSPIFCVGFDYQ